MLSLALWPIVLLVYLPAILSADFIWDDFVIGTDIIRQWDGLRRIWFSPADIPAEGHYWPLTYTSFWLENKLWGGIASGYHTVNVLLHLANTLLLWHLLRRLAVPGAWMAAAVFAVHPVHVESVAWIIERKDVLSGMFYLLAAAAWVRFAEQARPRWYLSALAAYVGGLLSKSVVVTLPVALLIWHWWKRGRLTWTDLLQVAPFFVVGAAITYADLLFNRSRGVASFDYSLVERLLIASRSFWFYVGKLFWPLDLAGIYPHWEVRAADPLAWAGLGVPVVLVAVLWLLRRRIGRGPLAGVLFFAVTLSPVLGFVDFNFMLFSFVADRYQYLASIGITTAVVAAAASGLAALRRRDPQQGRATGVVLVVLTLALLGTLSARHASLYADGVRFFTHVVSYHPTARDAHLNLASELLSRNRFDEAIAAYRVAEEQRPHDCKPPYGAGLALYHLGRIQEAEDAYQRALDLCPAYGKALTDFAELRLFQQRYEGALRLADSAIEVQPRNASAWIHRGRALRHLGRDAQALDSIDRALAIEPSDMAAQEVRAEISER
ncbi:MAG: tetratricopeptide repeat protein [Spirochaetaceae bacterium]|nr:tetratricopeptide repeat protein [Spirochaetaceae bacterium]